MLTSKPLAIGVRHGTPGAATDATSTPADTAAEKKAAADKAAAAVKKPKAPARCQRTVKSTSANYVRGWWHIATVD